MKRYQKTEGEKKKQKKKSKHCSLKLMLKNFKDFVVVWKKKNICTYKQISFLKLIFCKKNFLENLKTLYKLSENLFMYIRTQKVSYKMMQVGKTYINYLDIFNISL